MDSLPEFGRAAVQHRDEPKPKAIKVAHGSQHRPPQSLRNVRRLPKTPWPPTLAGSRSAD